MADIDTNKLAAEMRARHPSVWSDLDRHFRLTKKDGGALIDERDKLLAEIERLCLHGAEPTSEEWRLLRMDRDKLLALVAEARELIAILALTWDPNSGGGRRAAVFIERTAPKEPEHGN